MAECGKKPVLAIDRNMSNFLMHLRGHHLEQYAEQIAAQEKGELNTAVSLVNLTLSSGWRLLIRDYNL